MAASAPNPSNLVLLAGLGIGAYWLLTRRAVAAPQASSPSQYPNATPLPSVLGSLVGLVKNLAGSNTSPAAMAKAASVGAANAVSDASYSGADWSRMASSAIDGVAYNPPVGSAYDNAAAIGAANALDDGTYAGADWNAF